MQEKTEKKIFPSEKIAFELLSFNCFYQEEDTFHRKPMC